MKINKYSIIIAMIISPFMYFSFKYSSAIYNNNIVIRQQINTLNKYINELENKVNRATFVNAYKVSQPVIFCDDTLDISDPIMREAIEREFYVLLTNHTTYEGKINRYAFCKNSACVVSCYV